MSDVTLSDAEGQTVCAPVPEKVKALSDALADDSLSALADRMLLAVDETGEDWVLPDGNLHYQVSQDGEYGNTDYPYLTYDDLFKLQKYLSDRFSRTDPVLDLLMQHKRAWMDANGITAYMK